MKASTALMLNVVAVLVITFACYILAWLLGSFVWMRWAAFLSTAGSRGLFVVILVFWAWSCFKDPIFSEGD